MGKEIEGAQPNYRARVRPDTVSHAVHGSFRRSGEAAGRKSLSRITAGIASRAKELLPTIQEGRDTDLWQRGPLESYGFHKSTVAHGTHIHSSRIVRDRGLAAKTAELAKR